MPDADGAGGGHGAGAGEGAVGRRSLLDAANRAIIEALQRDGRQPYGAIAEAVGLSEAAVRRRVQRLREIGDHADRRGHRPPPARLHPPGHGRHHASRATCGVVADKLVALPEVDYVVMCAGSFDLLAEIVCEDDERLLHVLNDSVRSIPGVRATETFLYLKLAKQTYTWGTR